MVRTTKYISGKRTFSAPIFQSLDNDVFTGSLLRAESANLKGTDVVAADFSGRILLRYK